MASSVSKVNKGSRTQAISTCNVCMQLMAVQRAIIADIYRLGLALGEIPVFLTCPDVDPMHSPKIGYSLCSQ